MNYSAPYELLKSHKLDSGYDVKSIERVILEPNKPTVVQTGVRVELDPDIEIQVRPRSGLSSKGIEVILGTVDPGYRGPIGVIIINRTDKIIYIEAGDRVAQIVFNRLVPVDLVKVDYIDKNSERGDSGFGSTGL